LFIHFQLVKLTVKEVLVHKKFIKSGKATIKLPDQRLQLMVSNCPPDQLIAFVKTLQVCICYQQHCFKTGCWLE
jgi:hypothetical protein